MEDGISGGLQHCHETCCEKGGHHGRRACMVQRWFHHGNVVSGQVDLYMTPTTFANQLSIFIVRDFNIESIKTDS